MIIHLNRSGKWLRWDAIGRARARFGMFDTSIPAYQTVAEIRMEMSRRWGVPLHGKVYLGSKRLPETYIVMPFQEITFYRG